MACGLPVIAGNADGSVDALKNGQLGKLIDPNNEMEILRSLSQINTARSESTISGQQLQLDVTNSFGFANYRSKVEKILLNQ